MASNASNGLYIMHTLTIVEPIWPILQKVIKIFVIYNYYSYGDSVDYYLVEEESRFLLPLKEYIGFCDSLR